MPLKIVTWNIACGAEDYLGQHAEEIADYLASLNADVCLLQEVDRNSKHSSYMDIPKILGERTGMNVFFEPCVIYEETKEDGTKTKREFGNCILTKPSIQDKVRIDLFPIQTLDDDNALRTALLTKIENNGKPLWIANTHLAFTPRPHHDSEARVEQVEKLLEGIDRNIPQSDSLILAGDMNCLPTSPDLSKLKNEFQFHTARLGPTWPTGGRLHGVAKPVTIDHVFSRHAALKSINTIDKPDLSDHSVVVCEFEL